MAIVPQKLYVIRDTVENKIKEGAKGQFAFDSSGAARRSLVHANWWIEYRKYEAIRRVMPNAAFEFNTLHQLNAEYDSQAVRDWRNVDSALRAARNDQHNKIDRWARANYKEYRAEEVKIKFAKQKRYVVESLVQIETQEIT